MVRFCENDATRRSATQRIALSVIVGWLDFNVPFQHKYGYIGDEPVWMEALGQCIPPPRHVLPVSRSGSGNGSGSVIQIKSKSKPVWLWTSVNFVGGRAVARKAVIPQDHTPLLSGWHWSNAGRVDAVKWRRPLWRTCHGRPTSHNVDDNTK